MKRVSAAAFALALTTVTASGQQVAIPPPGPAALQGAAPRIVGTGLIMGRVVDADNRPVPAASVALQATVEGGVFDPQRVLADATGQFVFTNLPRGTYGFGVQSPGFFSGPGYGQRRPGAAGQSLVLADGQKVQNVILRLWRLSSISGRVTDEAGEPVAGIPVQVMRRTTYQGSPRLEEGPSNNTDDRGYYRIYNVLPADYVVSVPVFMTTIPDRNAPPPPPPGPGFIPTRSAAPPVTYSVGDFTLITSGSAARPPAGEDGKLLGYATTYAPDALSPAQAQTISLKSGEQRANVDIQITALPMSRVSGTVMGPGGPRGDAAVELVRRDLVASGPEWVTATGRTLPNGAFTMFGVPPGQYMLRARVVRPPVGPGRQGGPPQPTVPAEPTLWASMPVTVADADVAGMSVTLAEGPRFSGRVEFIGARPPTPEQLRTVAVSFAGGPQNPGQLPRVTVDERGVFESPSFVPGMYLVRAFSGPVPAGPQSAAGNFLANWALKSVTAGGREYGDAAIPLGSTDVTDVVITMSDTPTQLSGIVRGRDGQPDRNAAVLIFPSDRQRWLGGGALSFRYARSSASGAYSVLRLPPGSYFVAAIDDETAARWPDPSWLELIARQATTIVIADAEKKTADLRTTTVN